MAGIDTVSPRRAEAGTLMRIATPLIAAYVAELAMFLTTKMIIGRLGFLELAAVGISADLAFELLVVAMGLLSVVGVLVAQAEGADDRAAAGIAVRQGMLVALLIGLPVMVLTWNLDVFLTWTGQDPQVVVLARPYLHAITGSVLPVLWFSVLRVFVSALARTNVIMVITVSAVGLNYVLTNALVNGLAGLPALGVAGAGWATTIVTWAMLIALLVHIFLTCSLRGYGIFFGKLRVVRPICAEILRLGIPVGALVAIEAGLFVAISILSGVIGAKTLATYQVISGWIGIPFVVALGLAEATMVRVAYGVGRRDPQASRNAGAIGMTIGCGILAVMTVIPVLYPELIVRIYMSTDDPAFAEITALAGSLLLIAAIFQVFDGPPSHRLSCPCVVSRTLLHLFGWPASATGSWASAVAASSHSPYRWAPPACGWALAAGLITTGTLLAWRFERKTRM